MTCGSTIMQPQKIAEHSRRASCFHPGRAGCGENLDQGNISPLLSIPNPASLLRPPLILPLPAPAAAALLDPRAAASHAPLHMGRPRWPVGRGAIGAYPGGQGSSPSTLFFLLEFVGAGLLWRLTRKPHLGH